MHLVPHRHCEPEDERSRVTQLCCCTRFCVCCDDVSRLLFLCANKTTEYLSLVTVASVYTGRRHLNKKRGGKGQCAHVNGVRLKSDILRRRTTIYLHPQSVCVCDNNKTQHKDVMPGDGVFAALGRMLQNKAASCLFVLACSILLGMPTGLVAQSVVVVYPFSVGATQCYSCGFGNYSNRSGAEVCEACAPGTYSPLNESTGCLPCANKTYSPRYGMSACIPCKTADYPGASVCPPPPANTMFFGTYCPIVINHA